MNYECSFLRYAEPAGKAMAVVLISPHRCAANIALLVENSTIMRNFGINF
jgi:hypothetical protein